LTISRAAASGFGPSVAARNSLRAQAPLRSFSLKASGTVNQAAMIACVPAHPPRHLPATRPSRISAAECPSPHASTHGSSPPPATQSSSQPAAASLAVAGRRRPSPVLLRRYPCARRATAAGAAALQLSLPKQRPTVRRITAFRRSAGTAAAHGRGCQWLLEAAAVAAAAAAAAA
jgi:hypothetical protein